MFKIHQTQSLEIIFYFKICILYLDFEQRIDYKYINLAVIQIPVILNVNRTFLAVIKINLSLKYPQS